MKKSIYVLGFIIIVLLIGGSILLKDNYKNEQDYLSRNNTKLNLSDSDDFSGLEILDKDLEGKKIVLTGEHHNLNKNQLIEMKLLKYLQKEIGVNYYLAEAGYSITHFINKYLESGNEDYVDIIFNCFDDSVVDNVDSYNRYKEVYEFNQSLPEDEQIRYVGIDIEPKPEMTYEYIMDVLKDESILTENLKVLMSEMENFTYRDKDDLENTKQATLKVLEDIKANEEVYMDMLEEDLDEFKHVLQNVIYMCDAYLAPRKEWNNVRDGFIYNNFKAIDGKLDNPIYFGQWGWSHIYQDISYENINEVEEEYIGSHLNKDDKYKGKVLSIHYGYYNKGRDNDSYSKCYIDKEMFSEYLDIEEDGVLFKLNSKNSPFEERQINLFSNEYTDFYEKPNTNFYEYMLLIKDSKPSEIKK